VILPGRVGKVIANLDTKRLVGFVGKGISIYTNDRSQPHTRVSVRANVLGSVQMLPGYEVMLSNRRPESYVGSFLARKEKTESGELNLKSFQPSVDWLSVTATQLTEKRPPMGDGLPTGFPGDWLLHVRFNDDAPYGRSKQTVRFGSSLPREPTVELGVMVDLQPPVSINAGSITLAPGETKTVLASIRKDLVGSELSATGTGGLRVDVEKGMGRFYKVHLGWSTNVDPAGGVLTLRVGRETLSIEVGKSAQAAQAQ
jgi:hypothetical protein